MEYLILILFIHLVIWAIMLLFKESVKKSIIVYILLTILIFLCLLLHKDYMEMKIELDALKQESIELPVVEASYQQLIIEPRILLKPIETEKPETTKSRSREVEKEEINTEPTPEIIEEPEPELRYEFTDNDIYLMARLLCGSKHYDGDGEYDIDVENEHRYDQISLVLCVVMNRVNSDKFPDTVEKVIKQKDQFSPVARWNSSNGEVSDIAIEKVTEWCTLYNENPSAAQTIPENHLFFSSYGKGVNESRVNWK